MRLLYFRPEPVSSVQVTREALLLHSSSDNIACPDCGLLQRLPRPRTVSECVRCGFGLSRDANAGVEAPLVFAAAALLLLLPAAMTPLMSLISFGIQRQNWLPTGVEALWSGGFGALATVVFLFSIAIPFGYLGLLVWVLSGTQFGSKAPLGRLFRWVVEL